MMLFDWLFFFCREADAVYEVMEETGLDGQVHNIVEIFGGRQLASYIALAIYKEPVKYHAQN